MIINTSTRSPLSPAFFILISSWRSRPVFSTMSQLREPGTQITSVEEAISPRRQPADGHVLSTIFPQQPHFAYQPSDAAPEVGTTTWLSSPHLGNISQMPSREQETPLDYKNLEPWTNTERQPRFSNLEDGMHFDPIDFSIHSLEFRSRAEDTLGEYHSDYNQNATGSGIEFFRSHGNPSYPQREQAEESRAAMEFYEPQHSSSPPDSPLSSSPVLPKVVVLPKARFPCLLQRYGCKAVLTSRNEWKRHIATLHMKMDSWLCNIQGCVSSKQKFSFYRKDLFVQHLKRLHAFRDEELLNQTASSCYKRWREPPSMAVCTHCSSDSLSGKTFSGPDAWGLSLDHVAGHLKQAHYESVPEDPYLKEWLIAHSVLVTNKQGELILCK